MQARHTCYLDNNATTPVAPEVLEAMFSVLREGWANPSSIYGFGKEAARQVVHAHEQVAALIKADPEDIVFTSCGTESINTVLRSAVTGSKRHLVTTRVEHPAGRRCAEWLASQGCEVTTIPVNIDGALDATAFEAVIRSDTALVSVMLANNETGVIFPVEEVARICARKGVPLHCDAVQGLGKVEVNVGELGADFVSLSGHKLYAPKGIGVLYVRKGAKLQPYLLGGRQERGRRAGTENVAGIVALGRAAELAAGNLLTESARIRTLRDRFEAGVLRIPGTVRNGAPEPRLPNTANVSFASIEAEALLIRLDQIGICASSGSACSSGSLEPSPVLMAMGVGIERARGAVRFSFGRYNTDEEVSYVLAHLPGIVASLRAASLMISR